MKRILLITFVLGVILNAQNIVNTIGGNTSTDQFIIENKNNETSIVVTREGNVGIGTTSTNFIYM